ncbi:hypothetical protein [Serratia bockelmannii]|uniref:hypothetical protein n=1 Tax=Serratia bockelmannii TaxID=2703793 RepID=UPI003CE8A948
MAWHSVAQAQALTGKSRRTLYRDMAAGRVSWRSNADGKRELETTELLRVYGELQPDGTDVRHTLSHPIGTEDQTVLLAEIRALRQEGHRRSNGITRRNTRITAGGRRSESDRLASGAPPGPGGAGDRQTVVAALAPLILTAAPPAWPTLHGRAINCPPVHRFSHWQNGKNTRFDRVSP